MPLNNTNVQCYVAFRHMWPHLSLSENVPRDNAGHILWHAVHQKVLDDVASVVREQISKMSLDEIRDLLRVEDCHEVK